MQKRDRRRRAAIAAVAALVGLAASVAMYLGLVHAVPLVDWGTDETELLRIQGAHDVRLASLLAASAGVLLLVAGARWTGGVAVATAGLLAMVAYDDVVASWGLLLVYVVALLAGCGVVLADPLPHRASGQDD